MCCKKELGVPPPFPLPLPQSPSFPFSRFFLFSDCIPAASHVSPTTTTVGTEFLPSPPSESPPLSHSPPSSFLDSRSRGWGGGVGGGGGGVERKRKTDCEVSVRTGDPAGGVGQKKASINIVAGKPSKETFFFSTYSFFVCLGPTSHPTHKSFFCLTPPLYDVSCTPGFHREHRGLQVI